MRCLFLCFLFAYGGYLSAEDSGLVWLGMGKAKCGGILIEFDIVLSAKSCIKTSYEVLWPFKTEISSPRYEHESADLVVLVLERSWRDTVRLIHTSELSNLKKGLRVHFTNKHYSAQNWIDDLEHLTITAFRGLEHPLKGSPMWSDFGVVGMMIGEKTALRLDPYFGFIAATIKTVREKRPKPPLPDITKTIVIEAQPVQSVIPGGTRDPEIPHPAYAEASAGTQVRNDSKPVESLGCACSQVRRGRSSSSFWNVRFFGRFFLR